MLVDKEDTEIVFDKTILDALREYRDIDFSEDEGDETIIEEVYLSPKRGSFSGEKIHEVLGVQLTIA